VQHNDTAPQSRKRGRPPRSSYPPNPKKDEAYKYVSGVSAEYLAYKTSRHVFANSVVGYMAWLLRVNGPMPLDDIFNHVMLAKEELRKPNGTTPNI